MSMKIGFLITARMKSTRLPKKLTLKIFEREIISLMLDRLKFSAVVDDIVIATSTNPQDDILEIIADKEKVLCYRGDEEDVLNRLYGAGTKHQLDYIINITGDCPLVAYDYIPDMIKTYKVTGADLITSFDLPHGFYFYGIKPAALEKVLEIKNSNETEVWGSYFTDTGLFKCINLDTPKSLKRSEYRLTLDYQEDYEFLSSLYQGYGREIVGATTADIIHFLDKNPKIVTINTGAADKYKERWAAQNKVKLK